MAGRILVVDDDPEILEGLQALLAAVPDCEVTTALGVEQGRAQASRSDFDIVISDEQMPDGRGSDMLAQLSREHPDAHYVLMSGFADFDTLLRGVSTAHIDHFLQKPYDPQHIVDWVSRTLRERSLVGKLRPGQGGPFRRVSKGAPPAGAPGSSPSNPVKRAFAALGAARAQADGPIAHTRAPPSQARPEPAAWPTEPSPRPPTPTRAPGRLSSLPATPARPGPSRALTDALDRTVNEGLVDIAMLIRWASEASRPDEKLKHVRMAQRRMEDAARNLEALTQARE